MKTLNSLYEMAKNPFCSSKILKKINEIELKQIFPNETKNKKS